MAVYTHVSAEALAALLARYDVGELQSAKGIAEGVENSNYLVDTDRSRFILTLYEKRVDASDLPFFLALLDHLAAKGLPVPRAIRDRESIQVQQVAERPACLIEFLTGVSVTHPTPAQTQATGAVLGWMHKAVADFTGTRANGMGLAEWHAMTDRAGDGLDRIEPGLGARVTGALEQLDVEWPDALPRGIIHADLFPDNVLMHGDDVTGVIDFAFACNDIFAYDFMITHASWCFSGDGTVFHPERAAALFAGYTKSRGLDAAECAALPLLGRGAAMRFLLSRAIYNLETPPDLVVGRYDPIAFRRRLDFYAAATPAMILGQ